MRYLPFIVAGSLLTLLSCGKDEITQPVEPPKVALQTEYRLQEVKSDSAIARTYTYNEQNLVSRVSNYYNIYHFHYVVPGTATVSTYYSYDNQYRVIKSGNSEGTHEDDSQYGYNADLLPATRWKEKYQQPLYEYSYDGNKLTELRTYDVNGNLVSTEIWSYANGDDNATSYSKSSDNYKTQIRFLKYDNANALRLAMPGIQDLELPISVNNVLKMEQTYYDSAGNAIVRLTDYTYEYNSGNFPAKSTMTTTENGVTKVSGPIYYTYNK